MSDETTLNMDQHISVGFGEALLLRNSRVVFRETPSMEYDDALTVREAERLASLNPEATWEIWFNAPLASELYRRVDDGKWILVARGEGFA